MIGRFSHQGVYQELLQSREFHRTALAGVLALASFLWDKNGVAPAYVSTILALSSVALNGLPIVWGRYKGWMERRVNVDELVSIAIVASLIQGEYLTAAVVSLSWCWGRLSNRPPVNRPESNPESHRYRTRNSICHGRWQGADGSPWIRYRSGTCSLSNQASVSR